MATALPPEDLEKAAPAKNLLTPFPTHINLSASVDTNGLMQSGRGTGPMKPRQPVEVSISMQVPIPARTVAAVYDRRFIRGK